MISGKHQIKKLTKIYIDPGNPLWSFRAYNHTELAREVFISPKSLTHYKASCNYVIRWYVICIKNAYENLRNLWAAYEQRPILSCGTEAALMIYVFVLSVSLYSLTFNVHCHHSGGKKYDLCNKM